MGHSKPVRLETAPTGEGESVHLFLEFTINAPTFLLRSPISEPYSKVSDTSMPFENPDVRSSVHTTTVMFHRLDLPVKPIDVCNRLVVLIGGFAQGYPTHNLGKMQTRL